MSQYDNNEQVNQGLDAAKGSLNAGKNAVKGGAKTGRKAVKGIKKAKKAAGAGKKATALFNPAVLKVVLIVLGIILLIVVICIVGNTMSSSFKRTYREDSIGSTTETVEKQIRPQTQEEWSESLNDDGAPKEDTKELADILHEVKQKDFEQIQNSLETRVRQAVMRDNKGGANVDYEASVRNIKTEMAENSHWIYPGTGASTTDTSINILMVDDDSSNQRVADRLEKTGAKVTTVFSDSAIDATKYDALVIPGGGNTTPSLYGEKKSKYTSGCNLKKDKLQIKAVKAFAAQKKPILGLCRGCQLINVAFGGTIDQGDGTYHKGWDTVTFVKGSWAYGIYGKKLSCCHYHKQQIKKVAPGFKVSTWGNKDGQKIIEGIEHESLPIYCTQWHPDFVKMGDDGQKIFDAFVEVIKKQKGITGAIGTTNSEYKSSNPAIQGAIDWAVMIANDDTFNYGVGKPNGPANQLGCYFCKTNGKKVRQSGGDTRYYKTYVCMTFVTAAYAHGANDPEMLKDCKDKSNCIDLDDSNFTHYHCWKKIGRCKDLKVSDMEPGDVIIWWAADSYGGHASMYLGGNDIVDAGERGFGKDTIAIRKGKAGNYLKTGARHSSKSYVMRYVGSGNGSGGYNANAVKTLPSYDSLTVTKTLSQSTGTRKDVSAGNGYVFQSFAYYKNNYYLLSCTAAGYGSDGRLHKLDSSGSEVGVSKVLPTGHGNGITYCTKDNMLYSVTTAAMGDNMKSQKLDPEALKSNGEVSLKRGSSSIAYDRITNRFILSSAGNLLIYESDLKTATAAKKIVKKRWKTPGDICAYNGVIYVTISKGTSTVWNNYIDMYREEDGAYLGSYSCPYYEIEGIDIDDSGKIILLFHGPGFDFLQFTGLTALGGLATNSGGAGISVLDMDIIAAYNLSIANSSMYVNEDRLSKGKKEGVLEERGYRDVSGKKVKVYWFGKNKGLINYKKDFKKKINSLFKGDPLVRSSSNTILIDKPDSTKWYHLLVNADNKIPDGYSPKLVKINKKYISSGDSNDKWRNRVDKRIYKNLKAMMDDCTAAMNEKYGNNSHRPLICSAYRTYDMQKELYDSTANKNDTAIPGTSEHECGLAVDIVDKSYQNLDDKQAEQAAQKWLMENCQNYGFILRYPKGKQSITGIIWEPWHYRYVGKTSAKAIMRYGCTLEEYLSGTINTGDDSGSGSGAGVQAAIDWAVMIANDDSYTYGSGYSPGCAICGTRSGKHWTCMPFITAAYAHGAKDPDVLALCQRGHGFSLHYDTDWEMLVDKGVFQYVGKCSELNFSDIQPGDIFIQHSSDDQHGHMSMYIGGDDIVHAASFGFGPDSIKVSKNCAKRYFNQLKNGSSQCGQGDKNFIMRYIGDGGGDPTDDSKHFYKIVLADKPEKTTSADGKEVKYYPATLKEKEVDELLAPIFGLDPNGQYLNSKTEKQAKLDAAKEAQSVKETAQNSKKQEQDKDKKNNYDYEDVKGITESQDSFQLATMGKEGSATNLEAAQTLSDETGQILFGNPIYVANIGNMTILGASGTLAEPLGSYSYTWTSPFGKRWGRAHTGVDLAAPSGTKIYAAHDGTVTRSAWYGGYGNCCDITSGNMTTRYGHMCTLPVVKKGDPVKAGQLIGYVGSTGNSTGPHLHFEVILDGTQVDPVGYLGSLATAPKSADFND